MSNVNVKVIYSLRIHILLQEQGFCFLTEMKNPKNPKYNCWVYEATPEFLAVLDNIIEGGSAND